MPGGFIVTVPGPSMATSRRTAWVATLKVTLTVCGVAEMVTVHAPVPAHAPPQPTNAEPPAGAGVSVTTVPMPKINGQSLVHESSLAITTPPPVPRKFRLSVPAGPPASKRRASGGGCESVKKMASMGVASAVRASALGMPSVERGASAERPLVQRPPEHEKPEGHSPAGPQATPSSISGEKHAARTQGRIAIAQRTTSRGDTRRRSTW